MKADRQGESEMVKHISVVLLLLGFVINGAGCAFDLAHVSFKPTQFTPQSETPKTFTLKDAVKITQTPCGYARTLRQGTRYDFVGTISDGEVYKSRDQVLTVECSNVFEAYLVVSKGSLVGFYLPVEKGFVSISKKIELPVR